MYSCSYLYSTHDVLYVCTVRRAELGLISVRYNTAYVPIRVSTVSFWASGRLLDFRASGLLDFCGR
jgi:hypothetical protein